MPNELKSESIGELAKALSKAQSKIRNASTDKTNPHFRSKYADLSSVWEACREPLTENGLSITQVPCVGSDGKFCLQTLLLHTSGEWISGIYPVNSEKATPQAVGSALTYARRYSLACMAGVAPSGEDDDGNQAERNHPEREAPNTEAFGSREPQRQPPRPQAITADMPLIRLAQYRCPIGKKFKDTPLGQIPLEDLESFVNWLHKQAGESQKPHNAITAEFLTIAEAFLDRSQVNDQMAKTFEG